MSRARTTAVCCLATFAAFTVPLPLLAADYEVETLWETVESSELEPVSAVQQLEWTHWGLDLFLWDVAELQGRAQFRFMLQLKPGQERSWASIGFPRYLTDSGRWHDAVTRGVVSRSRVVEASVDRSDHVFFSVVVPLSTSVLSLPVGDDTIRIETGDWIADLSEPYARSKIAVTAPPPVVPASAPAPGQPARLTAGLRWSGEKPFGDGALDGGEQGELFIDVFNEGDRVARGVTVHVTPREMSDVVYRSELPVFDIDPGGFETVALAFEARSAVADGTATLSIEVVEPYGHDAAPIEFELTTRSVDAPILVLTDDFAIDGADLPLPRDRIVTLHLRVRNVGQGSAHDVAAQILPGEGVYAAHDSPSGFDLGDLAPGEVGEITYRCYANQRAERVALQIDITDSRTLPEPASSMLTLPLENADSAPRIVRVSPDPRSPAPPMSPPPPPLTSDVDRYVPDASTVRPHGLAVVLGVERYASIPPATYAASDARTAARYFENAFGVPPERIELLLDDEVTLAQMNRVFGKDGWLARRIREDTEVFVYFAGHGTAEAEVFDPYLIPSDGDLNYVRQTALSLDWIVERLASLDAASVTVFLDVCFSGLTREGGALLQGTRSLVVVPAYRGLSGVSLFSAARGAQSAHALDEEGHGLFSYFLFKGLGGSADLNRDRLVTTGELRFFLEEEIPRAASLADHEQSPAIFLDDENRVLVPLP